MKLDIKKSIVTKFSIYSAIILILLGFMMNYALSAKIEDLVIQRAITTTANHAQQNAGNYFTSDFFSNSDYIKNKDTFEKYYQDVKTNEIVRIKIFDTNGNIIYSDIENLVGQRFPDNKELNEAIAGEIKVEIKRNLDKEENIFEKREYKALMEIYAPIKMGSVIVGVVEVYHTLDDIETQVNESTKLVTSFIFIGFAVIYILLNAWRQ
ncbi:MAG: cell wall metabolism sensor histidine kinase WalK [Candidatus Methanoperedens sp.]|nr:cell wall metabolism sensor histidine kinase WalK [Candidatus Methanoperedens sp.]